MAPPLLLVLVLTAIFSHLLATIIRFFSDDHDNHATKPPPSPSDTDVLIHGLQWLLSTCDRDYLIRNNGDKVKVDDLQTKEAIGLYFVHRQCRWFTPILLDIYRDISSSTTTNGGSGRFEVVFVSVDEDEESFKESFSGMPWLAVPFSDSGARKWLYHLLEVKMIPKLVLLNGKGEILHHEGLHILRRFGEDSFPFTKERMHEMREYEKKAKEEQSLRSLLASPSQDYLFSLDMDMVPISQLEGKVVALYFSHSLHSSFGHFTQTLMRVYWELKERGESFEVVFVSFDSDPLSFEESIIDMPWVVMPFNPKHSERLAAYFELTTFPSLVVVGRDGKTVNSDAAIDLAEYGAEAYPFTQEKMADLEEMDKKRLEERPPLSWLYYGERDYLVNKHGIKVPVLELKDKTLVFCLTILSDNSCTPFMEDLKKVYQKLKEKGESFEVIVISFDCKCYEEYFMSLLSDMPSSWLFTPFRDKIFMKLRRFWKRETIPSLFMFFRDKDQIGFHSLFVEEMERTRLLEEQDHGVVQNTDGRRLLSYHNYPFDKEYRWVALLPESFHNSGSTLPSHVFELVPSYIYQQTSQSIGSLLGSSIAKDMLITKDRQRVWLSEIMGNNGTILLYFSANESSIYNDYLFKKMIQVYHEIKAQDIDFEVLYVSVDGNGEDAFKNMPWLALPFGDLRLQPLCHLLELESFPSIIAIRPTGEIISKKLSPFILKHGSDVYPFTEKRLQEVEMHIEEEARAWPAKLKHELHREHELMKTKLALYQCDRCGKVGSSWIFYCRECDFGLHPHCALEKMGWMEKLKHIFEATKSDGLQVRVLDIVGKNGIILLYFSSHKSQICRKFFMKKMIQIYHEIKAKYSNFEVIYISVDGDEEEVGFQVLLTHMPWFALPLGHPTIEPLCRMHGLDKLPSVIAINPQGHIVATQLEYFLLVHGSKAYPFTKERLQEVEEEMEDAEMQWPEKLKLDFHHEHELVKTMNRDVYMCDLCEESGFRWCFCCSECNFDLHPKCALGINGGN